ncbi:MAG TPA: MarR family transcriptional regulator [Dictyobacter sp.]|jgi:DNA-binding MarR family transcriptional regulator|nr:MarR family transcriptional regulator [Dictyobacter sp.]
MSDNLPHKEQDDVILAEALLEIVPALLRRIHADVPLVYDSTTQADDGLREISELRATPGQLSLLRVLVEYHRCTMQELAEHLAVAPSTVTAMVKRLLVHGYIERRRDDADWRIVWIQPTERGRGAFTLFQHIRVDLLCRRLDMLDEQERVCLRAALPALRHLLAGEAISQEQM